MAIRTIVASGKAAGTLTSDAAFARRYLELGATFVAVGVDVLLLANAARRLAGEFDRALHPPQAMPANAAY